MKITLVEAEIKEAISAYIFERVSINEGMELTVEIRATRGDDGATAEVDISAPKDAETVEETPETTQETSNPVRRTRRTKAEIEAARAAEEQVEDRAPETEEVKSNVADDYLAMTEAAETVTEEQGTAKVNEDTSEATTLAEPSPVVEEAATDEIPVMFRRDRTEDAVTVDEPTEEAAAPVKTGSLFGNLRRPQN